MVAAILSIVAYLLPLLVDVIRKWQESKAAAEADTYENNKTKFDQALVSRDAGGISGMFDRLSAPPAKPDGDPGG